MRELFHSPSLFIEIGSGSLKAVCENRGVEILLERGADGTLTTASRGKVIAELGKFIGRKSWQRQVRAVCGIRAQGVLLREISLPAAAAEDFENVLRLQIENEFPLSPDELAWGGRDVSQGGTRRRILVAAVRKKTIEEYANILGAAGAKAEFTVAALAREALCPQPEIPHALVEIGTEHSELVTFENHVPTGLRVLTTGEDLVGAIKKHTLAKIIFVSGELEMLEKHFFKLSAAMDCRRLELAAGPGNSAAVLGLKKSTFDEGAWLRLQTKPKPAKNGFSLRLPENRFWLVRAVVLLAVLLLFPLAEILVVKPFLQWRVDAFEKRRLAFNSVVEPESKFLLFLKQNQPPYLDALYLFSKAAPPGCHLDSLAVNQHGEISIKAAMPGAQSVTDFREKLIASGFFANLTVEEQTPIPNQPRVNVRMTAQWKPAGLRRAVTVPPPPKSRTNNLSAPTVNLPAT